MKKKTNINFSILIFYLKSLNQLAIVLNCFDRVICYKIYSPLNIFNAMQCQRKLKTAFYFCFYLF